MEEKDLKVSPPVDMDNKDENLDFNHLEFGIVTNLKVKYGLVSANPEEVQEMIKYVMDHGKAIRIVPLNPACRHDKQDWQTSPQNEEN